jgi:hypothetical protein
MDSYNKLLSDIDDQNMRKSFQNREAPRLLSGGRLYSQDVIPGVNILDSYPSTLSTRGPARTLPNIYMEMPTQRGGKMREFPPNNAKPFRMLPPNNAKPFRMLPTIMEIPARGGKISFKSLTRSTKNAFNTINKKVIQPTTNYIEKTGKRIARDAVPILEDTGKELGYHVLDVSKQIAKEELENGMRSALSPSSGSSYAGAGQRIKRQTNTRLTPYIAGKMSLPKSGQKREVARGDIVRAVMIQRGLSLPEASRFVKENNMY